MDWRTIFVLLHIFGTILGVGGVTFALVFSYRAQGDKKIDASEGAFLHITYTMLRVGLILLLFSGFGLLLYARLTDQAQHLYSVRLWLKLFITAALFLNTILYAARRMPEWLSHGISITGWYSAFILGAWRGYHWSFWTGVVVLALITIFIGLLIKKTPPVSKPALV